MRSSLAMRIPIVGLVLASAIGLRTNAQHTTVIDRAEYADRLEAFWLAQCIANWTGRVTEGAVREAPFFTDDDWGSVRPSGNVVTWVFDQDPWEADDDTDIEYVYINELHELDQITLTPAQLRQAWVDHVNRFIWVSNEQARELMDRGMAPPSTGLAAANNFYNRIDAQLTTEVFGALTPGLPHAALGLADLPIETTARSHAAHASRFHVLLYSLAPVAEPALPLEQRIRWMVETARTYIPNTSKAADIIDTVYADYLANPDPTDWERTRDLVYDRYQLNDTANGFNYLGWTESSVNFATGLVALLYGQGNFPETVRIGTLTGWDSDNGTATMGGLLGLLLGTDELHAQIQAVAPGQALSDRYWILRTRDSMPDYLPADPDAEDTFPLLAQRMLPIIDRAMADAGAAVTPAVWLLPNAPLPDPATASPNARRWLASANNAVRLAGGSVSTSSNAVGAVRTIPNSTTSPSIIANGFEHDDTGIEPVFTQRRFYASRGATNLGPGDTLTLTVTYSLPHTAVTLRLIEGEHDALGGWLDTPAFEIRVNGSWITPAGTFTRSQDPAVPFETIDFVLDQPTELSGVRLSGAVGGADAYATVTEIDALAGTARPDWPAYDCPADVNLDGSLNGSDFFAWTAAFGQQDPAADVNSDGTVDGSDFFAWVAAFGQGC